MGSFYGNKIRSGEINQKTGEKWKMEDVPSSWRVKTENWIKENWDL